MKNKDELKELRAKTTQELLRELKKNYHDLRSFRFGAKMRELKDLTKIKKIKRKIARILTVLREMMEEGSEATKG